MKKSKLTPEGETVLQVLISEYQMTREMALKLMAEGGMMLALAILQRRRG